MNDWKNVRMSINVFVILASLFMVAASVYVFKSTGFIGTSPSTNTISVSGHGESFAVPNIATVSFSVEKTAKTVALAQSQATTAMNEALASLKKLGIAEKDIQTTSYDVYPKYDYTSTVCKYSAGSSMDAVSPNYPSTVTCPPSKQVLVGYTVSQSISVKIRAIEKAGDILGALGQTNVSNVSGLTFSVEDDTAITSEARNKAITEAKQQAETLAKQLGVRLVRITNFSDSNGSRPVYYAKDMLMNASTGGAAAPSIPVGQNRASSDVTITYEIQ